MMKERFSFCWKVPLVDNERVLKLLLKLDFSSSRVNTRSLRRFIASTSNINNLDVLNHNNQRTQVYKVQCRTNTFHCSQKLNKIDWYNPKLELSCSSIIEKEICKQLHLLKIEIPYR